MHVIRLRKPWTKMSGGGQGLQRVDVPDAGQEERSDRLSEARYRRRFNRPTQLQEARVYLRITGWQGHLVSLTLNQRPLPIGQGDGQVDTEITSLLRPHNEIEVTLSSIGLAEPCLNGEVVLAIEESKTS